MNKLFKDLNIGEKFVYNNETYIKTEDERVSCCKVLNALKESNNEKIMITPLQEVQVN
jgi:hypothetical protein